MRPLLSLAVLAALAGCAQLRPPRQTRVYRPAPIKSEADAARAVQEWREVLGLKKFAKTDRASVIEPGSRLPGAKGQWKVEALDDEGEKWILTVSTETGRVMEAFRQAKSPFSTGGAAKKYTRGEDAMKDIADRFAPLIAGHEITLTSFDMGASFAPTMRTGSTSFVYLMGGGMRVHYSVLAQGKPFFTGQYGIDIMLDPKSGEINRYSESLDTPPTGSPIPLILPIAALATAEKASGVKPGTFASAQAILGWGLSPGSREARLYYYIDGSSGSVSYPAVFVSAENGVVDAALAKAIATAPPTYLGGGAYSGGIAIFSAGSVSLPRVAIKAPPKKKKP